MVARTEYKKIRIKNFLIFYVFICVLFVACYTFSRYIDTTAGTTGINIAKFNVSINDVDVSDGVPIQFNFSESSTFIKEKVAPNSNGYFEFIINPVGTEVSLEYEMKFDLNDLDKDFKLTYFTINDGDTHYDIADGNIIKGDLLLSNIKQGFTGNEKVNIKIYWSWEILDDIINPDINNYKNKNINVLITVKQKI